MEIETITQDKVTIVKISGSLDGSTAPQAQGEIMPLIGPNSLLVLAMEQCDFVSSAGLRVMLMVAKMLANKKGKVALACLSEEIEDIMDMTGFAHFFEIYDTVSEAVEGISVISDE